MDTPLGTPVATTEDPARVTITLGEGLDQAAVPDLFAAARAAAASGKAVAVRCAGSPFLPTGVVQVLAALRRTCRERGAPCTVEGVRPSAATFLQLAGLGSVFGS